MLGVGVPDPSPTQGQPRGAHGDTWPSHPQAAPPEMLSPKDTAGGHLPQDVGEMTRADLLSLLHCGGASLHQQELQGGFP